MSSMILFFVSVSRYGLGKAVSGMLRGVHTAGFWDDVVKVLLVQGPFRSSASTIAAISHMLEMVASLMAMVSRLGRLSLAPSLPFHHPWRRIGYILESNPTAHNSRSVIAESYQSPIMASGHMRAFGRRRYDTSSSFRSGSSERSIVNSIFSSANASSPVRSTVSRFKIFMALR